MSVVAPITTKYTTISGRQRTRRPRRRTSSPTHANTA
jgi:hypothetical protein